MESQINNALERVENPILIILLVTLMVAVVSLWIANRAIQKQLMDALLQNIQAVTNVNAVLQNMNERIDTIEQRLSSQKQS